MANNFPDWSGTWTDVKGFAGKTPWFTENWGALVDRAEDIANVIDTATAGYTTLNARHVAHEATTTEVVASRDGYGTLLLKEQAQDTAITSVTNEVNAARDGYGSLLLKEQAQDTVISQKLSEATGLTQNLDGNTYRAVDFSNAVDLQDLTTLSQVNAIAAGGGSPSAIPITDLNIGTATANQKIKVNGAGDAIIGVDDVTSVTGLDVGSATANQIIRVNQLGDEIIGDDQYNLGITGFSPGTATANQILGINSGGNTVQGNDQSGYNVTGFSPGSATANQYLTVNSGGTAIVGLSPVRYSASRSTQVQALYLPTGTGTGTYYLSRSHLVQGQYASGCTANASGTNLVNLPAGLFLVNFNINYGFAYDFYTYITQLDVGIRIDSNVGFVDGIGSHYCQYKIQKSNSEVVGNYQVTLSSNRIVNVPSSGTLGFTGYITVSRGNPGTPFYWYVTSANFSVTRC